MKYITWAMVFFLMVLIGCSDQQDNQETVKTEKLTLQVAPTSGYTSQGETSDAMKEKRGPAVSMERSIKLSAPLFSPHFAETPVALVNDEPIRLWELAQTVASRHHDTEKVPTGEVKIQDLLERLINIRLIVQEAKNIGLHETSSIKALFVDFEKKTLLQQLINNRMKDLVPEPDEVNKLYQQMSREVQIHNLIFKKAEDATAVLEEIGKGVPFEQLAARYIDEKKAIEENPATYMKIKDLLPLVGEAAYNMKIGEVSKLFQAQPGFILFKLRDRSFVEDPTIREKARQTVYERLKKQKARDYSDELIEKHAVIDEQLFEQLDFEQASSLPVKEGEKKTANFDKFLKDQRILATIPGGKPSTITVGALAKEIKAKFFHGIDKAVKSGNINKRKIIVFSNRLFKITGDLEARLLKLDQTPRFQHAVQEFKRATLFGTFVDKVVIPDVKIESTEVRQTYENHLDEYSSPVMLRVKSLVFKRREDAENAVNRLRKGADFKWVSANAVGLVDKEVEEVIDFDNQLLSSTSLPEGLQKLAKEPHQGDSFMYPAPGDDFYYGLFLEQVYPSQVQPFDQVKGVISKKLFNEKVKLALEDWIGKLNDAYDTQIFINDLAK